MWGQAPTPVCIPGVCIRDLKEREVKKRDPVCKPSNHMPWVCFPCYAPLYVVLAIS
jgi:hypothetical protein